MKRTLIQILDKEPDIRNFVGLCPHLETVPRYINLSDRYEEADSPELEQEAFLRWLEMAQLGQIFRGSLFVLTQEACHSLFSQRFPLFQQAAQKLAAMSQGEFEREHQTLENTLIDLKHALEDSFGYMVLFGDDEPVSFARFLRNAKPGKPHYLGGVFYYYD